jgi:hypothetical protein
MGLLACLELKTTRANSYSISWPVLQVAYIKIGNIHILFSSFQVFVGDYSNGKFTKTGHTIDIRSTFSEAGCRDAGFPIIWLTHCMALSFKLLPSL